MESWAAIMDKCHQLTKKESNEKEYLDFFSEEIIIRVIKYMSCCDEDDPDRQTILELFEKMLKSIAFCDKLLSFEYILQNVKGMDGNGIPDLEKIILSCIECHCKYHCGISKLDRTYIHLIWRFFWTNSDQVGAVVLKTVQMILSIEGTKDDFFQELDDVKDEMQQRIVEDLENRIKTLERFVIIGGMAPEIFDDIKNRKLFEDINQLLESNDILVQILSAEIAVELAHTDKGCKYLAEQNTWKIIQRIIETTLDDTLKTSLAIVLTRICLVVPSISTTVISKNDAILDHLNYLCENHQSQYQINFLTIWRNLMSCHEIAVILMDNYPQFHTTAMELTLPKYPDDVIVTCLESLSFIFQHTSEQMMQLMFDKSQNLIFTILDHIVQCNFPQRRTACYALLKELTRHPPFAKILFKSLPAINILKTSCNEHSSQAKVEKHLLIQHLVRNYADDIAQLSGKDVLDILTKYQSAGPFFGEIELNVSIMTTVS